MDGFLSAGETDVKETSFSLNTFGNGATGRPFCHIVGGRQDTAEAVALEEFYRSRFLYALSAPGEAAACGAGFLATARALHRPKSCGHARVKPYQLYSSRCRISTTSVSPVVTVSLIGRRLAVWFAEAPADEDTHRL